MVQTVAVTRDGSPRVVGRERRRGLAQHATATVPRARPARSTRPTEEVDRHRRQQGADEGRRDDHGVVEAEHACPHLVGDVLLQHGGRSGLDADGGRAGQGQGRERPGERGDGYDEHQTDGEQHEPARIERSGVRPSRRSRGAPKAAKPSTPVASP